MLYKKSRYNTKKIIKYTIFIVFISIALLLTVNLYNTANKIDDKKETDQTKQDSSNSKTDINTGTEQKNPTTDDIEINTSIEVNGNVTILVKLFNYSDGTCNLSITSGQSVYKETAAVIFQPSYSICAGFTVPKESLPKGNWTILLDVISKGITNSKSILTEIK